MSCILRMLDFFAVQCRFAVAPCMPPLSSAASVPITYQLPGNWASLTAQTWGFEQSERHHAIQKVYSRMDQFIVSKAGAQRHFSRTLGVEVLCLKCREMSKKVKARISCTIIRFISAPASSIYQAQLGQIQMWWAVALRPGLQTCYCKTSLLMNFIF